MKILYENTVQTYLEFLPNAPDLGADGDRIMGESEEWRRADDYYRAGPPGWTIWRVWVDVPYQYELWRTRGEVGRLIGMRASFEGALALYELQAKA